jgi:zinc transporter ZupT
MLFRKIYSPQKLVELGVSYASLCLDAVHNFLKALRSVDLTFTKAEATTATAIALHNIPEGISRFRVSQLDPMRRGSPLDLLVCLD